MADYSTNSIAELDALLESRSLLGFQLDASHLHDLLKALIRQQVGFQSTITRSVQQIENAVTDLDRRASKIEGVVPASASSPASVSDDFLGGGIRQLNNDLRALVQAFDSLQRQSLPEIRRNVDENRIRSVNNERSISDLRNTLMLDNTNNISQMNSALRRLPVIDQVISQHGNVLDQLNARVIPTIQREVEELRIKAAQPPPMPPPPPPVPVIDREMVEAVRSLQQRLNSIDREISSLQGQLGALPGQIMQTVTANNSELINGVNARWKDALEELNSRVNENFRIVEQSANAVDGELGKIRTDLANLRAEVNALDNNNRHRLGKITDDVDEKFKMLLDTLRSFETNSTEMQEAITAAGNALARSRQQNHSLYSTSLPNINSGGNYSTINSNLYGLTNVPGTSGSISSTTTVNPSNLSPPLATSTLTSLRPGGNYMTTEQYTSSSSTSSSLGGGGGLLQQQRQW